MRSVICLLLALMPGAVGATELRGLRLWDGVERTRVVFDLSASVQHKVFTLSSPDRVVIDIAGLEPRHAAEIVQAAKASGLVQEVRAARHDGGYFRVVFELDHPVSPQSFQLAPNSESGHRLVVDLYAAAARSPSMAEPVPEVIPDAVPALSVAATPAPSGKPQARTGAYIRPSGKPIVVAVDAGHGGNDPGALGRTGLTEKSVALAIARKLAALINDQPGYKAVLTRDGDYYVGLRDRVNRARDADADLFVSIHANAYKDRALRGSAVYALSPRGASSEHARWLAQKENSADMVGGLDLHGKDEELAAVLIDLSQASTMEASFDVGSRVLNSLGSIHRLQKKDVQQAGFMVLKAPDIPSILVETAFITNDTDEQLLRQRSFQDKIAAGVLSGVMGYFRSYRPQQQIAQSPNGGLVAVSLNGGDSASRARGVSN